MAALEEFTFLSVCLRLLVAILAGGVIGFGRAQRKQTAGMRTYIITSVGAALTTILAIYLYKMYTGDWSEFTKMKFDAARLPAAIISGIGFLAAGSIISVAHQQVAGLTTAIGLFVTAFVGIAAGLGFYEVVVLAIIVVVFVLEVMYPLEVTFKRKMRNMTLHVDFDSMEHIDSITEAIKNEGASIYEFEIEDPTLKKSTPSLILSFKLSKSNLSHSAVLASVAELPCVTSVQELIS